MDIESKKKLCRRASHAETKDDAEAQTCANLSQSKEIHLTYDVLRFIFQFLQYKDLKNVLQVSRSWLEAAYEEMQTRHGPVSFMEHVDKNKYNLKCLLDKIRNLKIDPYISIYFVCSKARCVEMKQLIIGNTFPKTYRNSQVIILHSTGIIIENTELEGLLAVRSENIICSFLPKIPNTDIRIFKWTNGLTFSYNKMKRELIKTVKQLPTPDEETSTCLILLNKAARYEISALLITMNKYSNKISSFWGGMIKECYKKEKSASENVHPFLCLGILITGRIKTWSTILENNCDTQQKVEEHLRIWKEQVQLKRHSIAYMFACHARGQSLYGKPHVESSIFKSLFPTLQLVGCFGDGEFGKFTLPRPKCREIHKENNCACYDLRYTQYSTVFMILTYD